MKPPSRGFPPLFTRASPSDTPNLKRVIPDITIDMVRGISGFQSLPRSCLPTMSVPFTQSGKPSKWHTSENDYYSTGKLCPSQ